MQSKRIFGAAVIFGGIILTVIAFAAANAPADQLGDPFVGHFSKHSIRYFILAVAALFSGVIMFAFGAPERGHSATRLG